MKRTDAFPSSYLKQDDLPRPPGILNVTIQDVRMETMPGQEKDEKPVMYFAGDGTKPMVLNNGNWETIGIVYGDDSDAWRGKPVELYVDPNVTFAGRRTGGIRVRVGSSNNAQTWTLQQALEACGLAGVTKEELVEEIKKGGGSGWNPARDTPTAKRLIEVASPSMAADQSGHEPVDDSEIPFAWALLLLPTALMMF